MQPQLVAEVTLYPTGGRKGPISPAPGSMFGCPCLLTKDKDAYEARDCRILLDGEPLLLGKPRKVGFVFLHPARPMPSKPLASSICGTARSSARPWWCLTQIRPLSISN
jgi:hypothetical protein